MAIQAHPIIASQKRQLKCESCTKIGHMIKSYPLNFKDVRDAESTVISQTVLDKVKLNIYLSQCSLIIV